MLEGQDQDSKVYHGCELKPARYNQKRWIILIRARLAELKTIRLTTVAKSLSYTDTPYHHALHRQEVY
ncbi:uncharacterized protein MELLADRAFT_72756 [Melampsora larici-populina 98AG31]|uniref:Uncharacterized protein n=1 Tax=Melampsora larici-populina (strain 98AG31 / pathotype 3-4-7) TaxID=747676 RepID=F4RYD6_MELLP|nr:uncharacterized protein MELLADRAFT_72756 [Melampsora larici-populina 98AG31]EGG02592.1 hypothetical protein MELLADRAFT_72756 [Melampsora larici-populina 98AG31]